MFVLLIELGRAAADRLVYVRTIGAALLHWQTFSSGLPGFCYGEELGGVMLTQLGSMKNRHTWAVTPSDVEDLFVQICPAKINRRLLVGRLSSDIETDPTALALKCYGRPPENSVVFLAIRYLDYGETLGG